MKVLLNQKSGFHKKEEEKNPIFNLLKKRQGMKVTSTKDMASLHKVVETGGKLLK